MAVSPSRTEKTTSAFRQSLEDNLYFTRGATIQSASWLDAYAALCYAVRDHLVERWRRTTDAYIEANPRFVYYLSAEYLLGKQLEQNLLYADIEKIAREALAQHDVSLDDLLALDIEPGLGNGGLGRLAACLLDSLATLGIPAVGYGIRYEFGIFSQRFEDGWQVEEPDEWLATGGYPFEFPQPDNRVEVGFGGATEDYTDESGRKRVRWIPAETLLGEPHTYLVPGFETPHVNVLRLWRARASSNFDFQLFDDGDYDSAVAQKVVSENLTKVLYPNDSTPQGVELRLKQQYFFVYSSLRDILRRFWMLNDDWSALPDKVAIQLNDTHPVVAIPELMRILVDENGMDWDRAWDLTRRTFAYTCHTLLPEALERWPAELFGRLLPRHLEIVYEINQRVLDEVRERWSWDEERLTRMSIVEETGEKNIRMAHLAAAGSYSINGVADLQSTLLRERTLRDFAELWPERFKNVTNGVSPRRFMRIANPELSRLITTQIGNTWTNNLDQLRRLEELAEDAQFRADWRAVKARNKEHLAAVTLDKTGVTIDPASIFDILVKRLHEYKRQLLKALHVVALYQRAKAGMDVPPRTFLFAAKAAPGYVTAKLIIKLINSIANVINGDPQVNDRLRVAFLPNFNVSLAQSIYPAADISEQISTAGMEASGTGNMKFALNGAITVGTLDGANIEIRDLVGEDNFFLFGLTVEGIAALREDGYDPRTYYDANETLRAVLDAISDGTFSGGDEELFQPLVDGLLGEDPYMLLADFQSYVDVQDRAAECFADTELWTRMSILNVARCGFFSSDRAVRDYCDRVWGATPVAVP